MKKALALVLALVLALSMAVSAFGLELVELEKVNTAEAGRTEINLVPVVKDLERVLYTTQAGVYYIALEDQPWTDVKVTANGNVTAELVEFDPEKMVILDDAGNDYVKWAVTEKGETLKWADCNDLTYDEAVEMAAAKNAKYEVTYYGITCVTNVNVIKLTIADNYTAHYTEGTVEIEAKLAGKLYAAELTIINDVTIFEYEQVKFNAANAATETLYVGEDGYSDYFTDLYGYDFDEILGEYDYADLRIEDLAAVISTTAFRAIEGKDIVVGAIGDFLTVTIEDVAKGQKGVNFMPSEIYLVNKDGVKVQDFLAKEEAEYKNFKPVAIGFGFEGNQVIASDFTVSLDLPMNWYELRELFKVKVEEDDIITYYFVKDGKVIDEVTVDYMKDDITSDIEIDIELSNTTLGKYEIRLDVPAVEGESNPNTGAESVVGVVAALAVVSLASAAAVSLKK